MRQSPTPAASWVRRPGFLVGPQEDYSTAGEPPRPPPDLEVEPRCQVKQTGHLLGSHGLCFLTSSVLYPEDLKEWVLFIPSFIQPGVHSPASALVPGPELAGTWRGSDSVLYFPICTLDSHRTLGGQVEESLCSQGLSHAGKAGLSSPELGSWRVRIYHELTPSL